MTNRVALFDIDGTLTSENVWKGIMTYFVSRRERLITHGLFVLTHYPLYFLRPYVLSEAKFRRLWSQHLPWYFRGYGAAQMDTMARWVIEHYVLPLARQDVLAILNDHLQAGDEVALVSGAPAPLVQAIARQWKVPHAIGSPVEFENGHYTGAMAGEPCIDGQKAIYIKRYFAGKPINFEESFAYADSYSDQGMFELVGHPVAVYPDKQLKALAEARMWRVIG